MKNNIQSSIIELAGEDVERVDGLPTAFRIFKQGENAISKLGIDTALILDASDIENIVGYHTKKSVKIPIDSEHFMRYIAKKNGIEESDLARLFPSTRGQIGSANLAEKFGDLWAVDVVFSEEAKPFIKAGALRYFSPTIKGLDGKSKLRVTSIGMVSNPGLDGISELAFSADQDNHPQTKGIKMLEKLFEKIAELTGIQLTPESSEEDVEKAVLKLTENSKKQEESITLSAELSQKIKTLEKEKSELTLSAEQAAGKETEIKSLKERISALELSGETIKRTALIAEGKRVGKVTEAQMEFLGTLSAEQIEKFLANAPVIAPQGRTLAPHGATTAEVSLSAEDEEVAHKMGISVEAMLETKKLLAKGV